MATTQQHENPTEKAKPSNYQLKVSSPLQGTEESDRDNSRIIITEALRKNEEYHDCCVDHEAKTLFQMGKILRNQTLFRHINSQKTHPVNKSGPSKLHI